MYLIRESTSYVQDATAQPGGGQLEVLICQLALSSSWNRYPAAARRLSSLGSQLIKLNCCLNESRPYLGSHFTLQKYAYTPDLVVLSAYEAPFSQSFVVLFGQHPRRDG